MAVSPGRFFTDILQIRQVDLHLSLQLPEGLHLFVTSAIVHHRHRQLRFQGCQDGRQEMGRSHQVDIVGPLANQFPIDPAQVSSRHFPTLSIPADFAVLAEHALKCAAGKEHGAAAARGTADAGLFPLMERRPGRPRPPGHPAPAQSPWSPVRFWPFHPTVMGTKSTFGHVGSFRKRGAVAPATAPLISQYLYPQEYRPR